MVLKEQITPELIEMIERIFKRGNTVELKKEQGRLVVVEIERRVRHKTSAIG